MEKKYKRVDLGDIRPYPNNPRVNDGAVEDVKKSIEQCGYIAPIIVDESMTVLAGHTRLRALQEIGCGSADVVVVSGLTGDQKRKYRLLDNKTGEESSWDFEKLADELDGLDFGDLDIDWGLDGRDDGREDIGDFSPSSFSYKEQYGVTVILSDEVEQEECYNTLTGMGYNCRVVTV